MTNVICSLDGILLKKRMLHKKEKCYNISIIKLLSCPAQSIRPDHLRQQTKSWELPQNTRPQTSCTKTTSTHHSLCVSLYSVQSGWYKGCGCYGDWQWKPRIKVIIWSQQGTVLVWTAKMVPGGGASETHSFSIIATHHRPQGEVNSGLTHEHKALTYNYSNFTSFQEEPL